MTVKLFSGTGSELLWSYEVNITVWRDGKKELVTFPVEPISHIVPVQQYDQPSNYFIFGGLVFMNLTQPYLHTWGDDWYNSAPRMLVTQAVTDNRPRYEDRQVVVVTNVLPHSVNMGARKYVQSVVEKVGGEKVVNLAQLADLVQAKVAQGTELIDFHFSRNRLLVLDCQEAHRSTEEILQRHRIPRDQYINRT